MNEFDIFEAVGEVSDYLVIESREDSAAVRERKVIYRVVTAAAVLFLVTAIAFIAVRVAGSIVTGRRPGTTTESEIRETSGTTDTANDTDDTVETQPEETEPPFINGIDSDELSFMRQNGLAVYALDDMRYESEDPFIGSHKFTRYYGIYGLGVVLFEETGEDEPTSFTVGGIEFRHSSGFGIYCLRGGHLFSLESAFGFLYLTGNDISEIAAKHNSFEPTPPTPDSVTIQGVVYKLYDDHAAVVGAETDDIVYAPILGKVNELPVTMIMDGAFDGMRPLRIACDRSSEIYDDAKSYAIENDHIFIGTGGTIYPERYYPDWVQKLDWRLRDTSEDKFVFVDDHDRITELKDAYLNGDESVYDELLRRVMYRYACAVTRSWLYEAGWDGKCSKYENSSQLTTGDPMTDFDRYFNYGDILDGGPYEYEFAYGSVDTYTEFVDYMHSFYVSSVADKIINDGTHHNRGDALYINFTGFGYADDNRNPTYDLVVGDDYLILTERREIWMQDSETNEDYFTGDFKLETVTLELHSGKWQLTESFYIDMNILKAYREKYGTELLP